MEYIFLVLFLVHFLSTMIFYALRITETKKMTFNKLLEKLDKTISNNNSAEAVRLMKTHFALILTNKDAFAEWLDNKQKGGEKTT